MTAPTDPHATLASDPADELERLRQFGRRLSIRMTAAAEAVQESGISPSIELLEDMGVFRSRMQRLSDLLEPNAHQRADDGINPRAASASGTSFDRLTSYEILQKLLESRSRMQVATKVRDQLSKLRHVDVVDFAPLALCRRESMRLCDLAKQAPVEETMIETELRTARTTSPSAECAAAPGRRRQPVVRSGMDRMLRQCRRHVRSSIGDRADARPHPKLRSRRNACR